ncbi:MAG: TetR/AcrR family transcriptional regulator [Sphingomonadales bacterium]
MAKPLSSVEGAAATQTTAPPNNRDKLLNAAEQLFATKGFDATTTREIARAASVPLGLMAYYFGTKSDLYAEVIARRAEEHVRDIDESMRSARDAVGGRPLTVTEMIKAYWRPILDKCLRKGPGWKAYIQILARAACVEPSTEAYKVPYGKTYYDLPQMLVRNLREAYPDASEADLYWGYYFLSSAMINMVLENGRIDFVSDGLCKSTDLETVVAKMAVVCQSGFDSFLGAKRA